MAARYPRQKNDLTHFEKFDPRVAAGVSFYGLFQLLAVIGLLSFMQRAELAYWPGLALWGLLLATTVTTALWLEGQRPDNLLKWEALRLLALALLLVAGWQAGVATALLAAGAGYLLLNAAILPRLPGGSEGGALATAA